MVSLADVHVSGQTEHAEALRNSLAGWSAALECFQLLAAKVVAPELKDTSASGD